MFKVGIVGYRGISGRELIRLIEKNEPSWKIERIDPRSTNHAKENYSACDLLFFCTPAEISLREIPPVCQQIPCIDLSSAFRADRDIPLVIPEINADLLSSNPPIIASPNCVATLLLLPLAPLHKKFGIHNLICTSLQSASGAGYRALEELENKVAKSTIFPQPLHENLFIHENYTDEEEKIYSETQKILNDPNIHVCVTSVRVPVKRAHSISLHLEFEKPVSTAKVTQILEQTEGVKVVNDVSPRDASGKESVFVSRIREAKNGKNSIEMWIVGDQLLKGAALNAFQIGKIIADL